MSGPRYCLLDIDGVLADFVGTACRVHGVENPYEHPDSPHRGNFDIAQVLGISDVSFWNFFNNHKIWEEMEPTDEMEEILETVLEFFPIDRIALCSAPSASPWSASGKMAWVKRNLFSFRRRLIITPAKEFLAHDNVVLIDDRGRNVDKFSAAGGRAKLFARPWNRLHALSDNAVEDLSIALEVLFDD